MTAARVSPALAARLDREVNRRLGPEELRVALDRPITQAERSDVRELVAWFRRRYPTPAERLRYVRRAYATWTT